MLKHFPELGAKVIDTARGYGESEVVIGNLLAQLGNRDKIFLATKTPIRGDILPGNGELETALKRLQTNKLDLIQIHNFHGIDELFPRFKEWKEAGKVRYIGVTTSTDEQYPQMKNALNTLPLDFIQVDYSIDNRGAADEILPLALDKGVAVLINVPLGGRRGNVLSRLADKPLPAFAAEFGATSWAQLLSEVQHFSSGCDGGDSWNDEALASRRQSARRSRASVDGGRAEEDRGVVGDGVVVL